MLETRQLKHQDSMADMHLLFERIGHSVAEFNRLRVIHIAGSKGKGSTAAFVESILRAHGLRTALFTSPHLVHPRERLRLDGRSMPIGMFCAEVNRTFDQLMLDRDGLQLPGFFRFLTVVLFRVMLERHRAGLLDVAIVEVGMGGRFDATNFITHPWVTAITSLTMEHVRALGPTLRDIAWHKAGIAKSTAPLVTVEQPPEAMHAIELCCQQVDASLHLVETMREEIPLGIDGRHQRTNAALAVTVGELWMRQFKGTSLFAKKVEEGLISTSWPGRHQIFDSGPFTRWFLDGAHTLESVQSGIDWFIAHNKGEDVETILIFHCSHDRAHDLLLQPILRAQSMEQTCFYRVHFVRPFSPMDRPEEVTLEKHDEMASYWREMTGSPASSHHSSQLIPEIIDEKLGLQRKRRILVIGSLYIVGDVLRNLEVWIP